MTNKVLQVHLTVTEPFLDYQKGDHIRDPEAIAAALRDYHHHVVQRIADDVHTNGSFYGETPA